MQHQKIYEVQTILDEAVINYEPHYLIKWKGMGHEFDTWEPLSSLKNISEYLKFWLNQRKIASYQGNHQTKAKNFHSIKQYLGSGALMPKKLSKKCERYGE